MVNIAELITFNERDEIHGSQCAERWMRKCHWETHKNFQLKWKAHTKKDWSQRRQGGGEWVGDEGLFDQCCDRLLNPIKKYSI